MCFSCVAFSCALFCTMAVVTRFILLQGGKLMPDYKSLYLNLLDGVEKAMEILKNVELACEEIYIDTSDEQ